MPKDTEAEIILDIVDETDENSQITVIHDGSEKTGTEATLLAAGVSESAITAALETQKSIGIRNKIRNAIYTDVADSDSILGTVADASQMLTLAELIDLIALDQASSFAEYKQIRMAMIADISGGDSEALITDVKQFMADVQSGEIIMPFLAKEGKATAVFKDIGERATGVAHVLMNAS